MKNIAIYGAGGFGREIVRLIKEINAVSQTWNCVGFFDDGVSAGTCVAGCEILGGVETLNAISEPLAVAFAIASPKTLRALAEKISNPYVEFPNIIAPNAHFIDSDTVRLGRGNIISPRSMISCDCVIGDFNLCVYDNIFGHDLRLGSFNIFNTSTRISGNVSIGDGNIFGVNFATLQQIKIGAGNVLGASSLLTHDVGDSATYIGVPAKKISL